MAPGQEWSWPLLRCWGQGTEPALGALVGTQLQTPEGACQGQHSPALAAPGTGMDLLHRAELLGGARGSQRGAILSLGNGRKAQASSKGHPGTSGSCIHEERGPGVCLEPPAPLSTAVAHQVPRPCTGCTQPWAPVRAAASPAPCPDPQPQDAVGIPAPGSPGSPCFLSQQRGTVP